MRAVITAVGHFAPSHKLKNKDLEQMVDTSDEWIIARTGIKERRILEDGKGTSHMAIKAAKMVLEQRGISADELDLIIVATVTPDQLVPPTASVIQAELNATSCWGYDLNGACAGFLCALATGAQFIESGTCQKVLIIGADKMSSIIDYQDRNTCILFGDAAGAVLLEPSKTEDAGIKDFLLHLDGSGGKYLYISAGGSLLPTSRETVEKRQHYLFQDGKAVYKHAVTGMAEASKNLMDKNGLKGEDIKLFIPHQANSRIIDAVAKKLGISEDKVFINIHKYGNTTAATIPLAMSEAYQEGKLNKGDWIIISAFGAGFTWGSLLFRWDLD